MAKNDRDHAISEIVDDVAELRRTFGVTTGQAFSMWFATHALDFDRSGAYEAVQVDGGNDHAVDFFWVDEEHDRVIVMQSKFSKSGRAKPKIKEFDELISAHQWLQQPEELSCDGRDDLAESAVEYLQAIEQGYELEYWYVFFGSADEKIERRRRVFDASTEARDSSRRARIVDLSLCMAYSDSAGLETGRVSAATMHVSDKMSYAITGAFGRALVTTVAGSELARLYREYSDGLFDSNVRLFLGSRKGSVNAGIRETLRDDDQRSNFWAFNNGITIVADRFRRSGDEVELRNFSIINGCQTTVSVANAFDDGDIDESVSVLARIITPKGASVDDIIRFNNSQNPIKSWSMRSQDRTQLRLKAELADLESPYFYLIRPGEKKTLTRSARAKYRPKGQRFREIAADSVAQMISALNGDPLNAYRDKGALFRQRYHSVFPPSIRVEEVVLAHAAGQEAEAALRQRIEQARTDADDLAVRILRKGGKIYVVACLGVIAERRNGPGYRAELDIGRIDSKRGRERIRKYATQAAIWYVKLVRPRLAAGAELATLVRSPEFYPELSQAIRDEYDSASQAKAWLDEALPRLDRH